MNDVAVLISNHNKVYDQRTTIDAIASSGFKKVFVQWYTNNYHKPFNPGIRTPIEYARNKGLEIIFAHLGYRDINTIWEPGEEGNNIIKIYLQDLKDLHELGIDLVMMHVVDRREDSPNKIGLERLRILAEYASSLGMKIAFENTKTKGYIEYIVDNLNMDNIGICYDVGHAHCHFKDDFDLSKYENKVFCVHIHDNNGEKDEHLIPGDGTVPWDKVLENMKNASYNGPITLELAYQKEYLNMNINNFYKLGYKKALELSKKYEEVQTCKNL